ncbi:hypothetical protein E2I00_003973, partial [Balaenoptera physalus]
PSLHCSLLRLPARLRRLHRGLRHLDRQSRRTPAFFLIRCVRSPAGPIMSDAAANGEQEADTEVDEEEEEGGKRRRRRKVMVRKRMEMKMMTLRQLQTSGQLNMMRMT